MIRKTSVRSIAILLLLIGSLLLSSLFPFARSGVAVAAQATGDTLPSRTPTSRPLSSPVPSPTLTATNVSTIWTARLVSNTLGVTEGNGSIFRVRVEGQVGTPIELRSGDYTLVAESGTKPEYGPYTAEFAPVTAGTWVVSVPSLGASISVEADGYNLAVIEFVQVPVPEASRAASVAATPTPLQGSTWTGRLVSETWGIGAPHARLLVQVVGLSGHPVRLSTPSDTINTANTGQKPTELGPDVVEFTGLTPARYIIEPLGLNSRFEVELKANTETRVEFFPQTPSPTPTATDTATRMLPSTATYTPLPPTDTPTPTLAPTPIDTATPTMTPPPTNTPTPLSSPTPVTRWLGVVEGRKVTPTEPPAIVVRVFGIEGLPIQARPAAGGLGGPKRCITGQGIDGQDACRFRNLQPGPYIVAPEGLNLSLPVMVYEGEEVRAFFDVEVLPSGVTGWQARIVKNTNGPQAWPKTESKITIRVTGRAGQVIALRSVRGTEEFCEVVPNPVLGSLVCEFRQLGPGVYRVEAVNTDASQQLFVDGMGQAEISFSPSATDATLALAQSAAIVGYGAVSSRPTATVAPVQVRIVQPSATPTAYRPVPTASPSPDPTATPPVFAWQGQVVETVDGVIGTIGVRAAGLKDHPVVLHSGDWQSPVQLTGTKPELGDYATEFGGLAQGEYVVELVDLAELKVSLGPNQFLLVEFRYDLVDP